MATEEEVIEAAIEKEADTLGEGTAYKYAREVEGLEIDEDGNVTSIDGDTQQILANLVLKYVDYAGDISATLIAHELSETDTEGVDLPPMIKNKM
ncbi:MAG: hypothetical protein ABEK01_01615 [Candidatus Nanohaloarchaea archaeon]